MSRIQQWAAGTVVALLLIVAAGWFLAIAPQKHKVSNLKAQSASQEQANSNLRVKLTTLKAQVPAVQSEQQVVDAVTRNIPNAPDMPDYVRALTTIAAKNGVELVSIAPAVPAAVAVPVAVVPTATPSASAPAATAAAPVAAAPAVSLQAIPVQLTVQGGYWQIQQFTAALQQLPRSTVITSVAMALGSPLKAPKIAPPVSDAYKSLQAEISVDVFMNSSAPFAIPTPPAQASGASVPGAGAASAAPAAPAASPSN